MAKTDGPTLLFKVSRLIGLTLLAGALGACVHTRPTLEYVLARDAFAAARETESARYAPGFYHKAEESYRRGVAHYTDGAYEEAIEEFKTARVFAEKAENAAHIQRQRTGDEAL